MAIELYSPNQTLSLSTLSPSRLLQLSRPTSKCRFVRQGDSVHLLLFLHEYSEAPFIRVDATSLYNAAKRFIADESLQLRAE